MKRWRGPWRPLFLVAAIWGAAGAASGQALAAAPFAADFGGAETASLSPTAPLSIRLAPEPSADALARIALELDGVDVTAFAGYEAGTISFEPLEPLAEGDHDLRLVLADPSGSGYEVVGAWTFAVGAPRDSFVKAYQLTAEHEAAVYAVEDGTLAEGRSAGSLWVNGASGPWQAQASASYLGSSVAEERLTGNPIDLGEYAIEVARDDEATRFAGRLGDQTIDYDDLLVADLYRRGASVEVGLNELGVTGAGFAARAQNTLGADNITGLKDDDDRLYGGALTFEPYSGPAGTIRIMGAGYSGEGSILEEDVAGEGSGYAASLFAQSASGRTTFRSGYARTDYDSDGGGDLIGEEEGEAYGASLEYRIPLGQHTEDPANLVLGIGYERVDGAYYSLANPFIAPDREDYFANADYARGGLNLSANALYQTNNADDLDTVPTDRTVLVGVNGTYLPFYREAGPAWLGDFSISFGAEYGALDRIETPLGLDTPDSDAKLVQANLGIASYYSDWGWSLGHTLVDLDDQSGFGADRRDHITDLSANWFAGAETLIDGALQWTWTDEQATGTSNSYALNLGLETAVSDTVSASARYAANFASGTEGFDGGDFNAELAWRPENWVTLGLRTGLAYGASVDDDIDDDTEAYGGFFLRLNTSYERAGGLQ